MTPHKRIWSLYDMLEFNAARFFNLAITLEILKNSLGKSPGAEVPDSTKRFLCEELDKVKGYCEGIGLPVSVIQIDRAIDGLKDGEEPFITFEMTSSSIRNISLRIQDELSLKLFLHIPSQNAEYYLYPRKIFSVAVLDKFPSITNDVESACRCYATGNFTASVFHLMRIMECGLRALGASLNDNSLDPKRNPSWENILRKCDDELRKKLSDRCPEWKTDEKFFSDATANLRAVKDAWRNPTMHIDQIYDSEQALAVFNAVRGFMRQISQKLSEWSDLI